MLEFKDKEFPSGLEEDDNDEPYDKHHGFVVSF